MPPRIPGTLPALNQCPFASSQCLLNPAIRFSRPAAATTWSNRPRLSPHSSCRAASILSRLSDNPTAYHKQKRRGRGPSSGLGKTSGRGHKGQKQHGKVPAGFEGGQTPLRIVHGIRGFKNNFASNITSVPLTRIQSWIRQKRLDPSRPITPRELLLSRCIHQPADGIKLLASSQRHDSSLDAQPPLTQPLHIVVSRASAAAIRAVEQAGGSVTTRYYTRWAMQQIVRGKMDPMVSLRAGPELLGLSTSTSTTSTSTSTTTTPTPTPTPTRIRTGFRYRLPDPTRRKDLEYYRDPDRRGYLAYTLGERQGPSLFFATEEAQAEFKKQRRARQRKKESSGTAADATAVAADAVNDAGATKDAAVEMRKLW